MSNFYQSESIEYDPLIAKLHRQAEEGNIKSQLELGKKYYKADGVPQDFNQTFKWIKKAALQGDASAQYKLAWLYDHGKGVEKDPVRAYYYFDLAATNGNLKAKSHLECLNKGVSPESIAETKKMIEICSKDIWSIRSTDDLLNWIVCNL